MPMYRNTLSGDVVTAEGPNADHLDEHPDWELVKAEAEDGFLKGAALDEALDDAGLSKSGTADEKRARLDELDS